MATGSRIYGALLIDGVTTLKSSLMLGDTDTIGTSRDIEVQGVESDIILNLITKGIGTVQVPVGYEDNISVDQDVINKGYMDTHIAGLTTIITDPGTDSMLFWDESESHIDFLDFDATLAISATTIGVAANTSVQKVAVRKNSTGGDVGTRRRLNFIEGTNITLTIADDAGADDELDITIASSGGGGSGTVTDFSAGNLSPLFTTSEATTTTTPALTFTAVNQSANLVYAGPASGGAAAPTFRLIVTDDITNDAITDGKLRDSLALSVMGNPTNAVTNPTDIVAGTDGHILRRSGTTVGFGTIGITSMSMSTDRILGRTTASSGAVEELQVDNGIDIASGFLKLGGALTANTTITGAAGLYSMNFTGVSGFNATAQGSTGSLYIGTAQAGISFSDSFVQVGLDSVIISADSAAASINISSGGITLGITGADVGDTWYANVSGYVTRIPIGTEGQVWTVSSGIPTWETPAAALSRPQAGTSYTLDASDNGYTIYFTEATGVTVNIPDDLDDNFSIIAVRANGAGIVTFAPDGASVLNTVNNETTIDYTNGHATWHYRGANQWYGAGALGTIVAGTGTVTEVRLSDITSFATATGTPISGDGTLGYTLDSQAANYVFAGPASGSAATPTYRLLVMRDIPLDADVIDEDTYLIVDADLGKTLYFIRDTGTVVTLDVNITIPNFWVVVYRGKEMTTGNVSFVSDGTAILNSVNNETEIAIVNGSALWEYKGSNDWYGSGALGSGPAPGGSAHIIKSHGSVISPDRANLDFTNGLYAIDNNPDTDVKLGGALTENTTITGATGTYSFSATGLSGLVLSENNGFNFELTSTSAVVENAAGTGGLSVQASGSTMHQGNRLISVSTSSVRIDTTSDSTDATGDMYYRAATSFYTRLAVGGATTVLGGNGTLPVYKTVSNGLVSDATTLKWGGALTGNTSITGNFTLGFTNNGVTITAANANQANIFTVEENGGANLINVSETAGVTDVIIGSNNFFVGSITSNTVITLDEAPSVITLSAESLGIELNGVSNLIEIIDNANSQTVVFGTGEGLTYGLDYSLSFVDRSLIDKDYDDTHLQGIGLPLAGTAGQSLRRNAGNTAWENYTPSAGGAVSSVTLTQPTAGLTITNTGVPQVGATSFTFALSGDLNALENLASTGFAVKSAATPTWVQRSIAVNTGHMAISNGDGIAGNPTISISFFGFQNLTNPGGNRYLTWNNAGSAFGWQTPATDGTVGYWSSGILTGEAAFAYNATTNILSVDGLQMGISTTAGSDRTIEAIGSASNINPVVKPKGAGNVVLAVGTGTGVVIGDSAVAGTNKTIFADSSGSNVDLSIQPKGTGYTRIKSEMVLGTSGVATVIRSLATALDGSAIQFESEDTGNVYFSVNGGSTNGNATLFVGDANHIDSASYIAIGGNDGGSQFSLFLNSAEDDVTFGRINAVNSEGGPLKITSTDGDIIIDPEVNDINLILTASVDVVVASTHTIPIKINGVSYKVLIST